MRNLLLAFLLIEILLTACSDNSQSDSSNDIFSAEHVENRYIAVNLITPGTLDTRAEDEENDPWSPENGTDQENKVSSVRFFFFDSSGDPVNVRKGSNSDNNFSYIDLWVSTEGESSLFKNDENLYSAILNLELQGGRYPTQLIAVVNPNTSVTNLINPDIITLSDFLSDFTIKSRDDLFVMSNSAYVLEDVSTRTRITATQIAQDNFFRNENDAYTNSVVVYVERIVARIDLSFDMDEAEIIIEGEGNTNKVFPLSDPKSEKEIYVRMLGWAVTSTPDESRLIKYIDENWSDSEFFSEGKSWNHPSSHRSFWAINPATPTYNFYSFNDISGKGETGKYASGCFEIKDNNTAYIHENANPFNSGSVTPANPSYPSKVICAGQLIDSDGNPLDLAEYNSKYYTVEDLKDLIAESLDMYFKSGEEYVKILPEHIIFETSMEHNSSSGPNEEGTYYVYAVLSPDAGKMEWFHDFDKDAGETPVKIENPEDYIDNTVFPVKIWTEGYTYYFFDIPHYGVHPDHAGYLGVVRNHFYDATVVAFTNLGTPVYNPKEAIYPEKPETYGNNLEVTVNVIQWRKIEKNFQMSW